MLLLVELRRMLWRWLLLLHFLILDVSALSLISDDWLDQWLGGLLLLLDISDLNIFAIWLRCSWRCTLADALARVSGLNGAWVLRRRSLLGELDLDHSLRFASLS